MLVILLLAWHQQSAVGVWHEAAQGFVLVGRVFKLALRGGVPATSAGLCCVSSTD